eukprot:4031789-Ditylum_brightwellii.AAC.1
MKERHKQIEVIAREVMCNVDDEVSDVNLPLMFQIKKDGPSVEKMNIVPIDSPYDECARHYAIMDTNCTTEGGLEIF